jgi:hypothetical protein
MLYTWRRQHRIAALTVGERKRCAKQGRRSRFIPYLERLEGRDCPTTLTPQFPTNLSQLVDNQTDQTVAISPVEYDPVNHLRHVFVASTTWHGGYDGASYFAGGTSPYSTSGLFYWYGHMNSSGQVTRDGNGIMATGTDDHEPGYGLPAAGHFPHATFDQYDNLFLSYMTDKVQARGVGSTPQYGNTLTDPSAHWFPNEWAGKDLWFDNQTFSITGNTSNTLTFSPTFQYYQPWSWYYQIVSRGSSFQNMEVVQSTDGGTFTWQLDGPPAHPQNFAWLASYNDIASGPYGPLQPIVATGPGFGDDLSSGTTTGLNSATTLNDTTANWTPNAFVGDLVEITSGIGAHQAAVITANSATQLTLSLPWGVLPDVDPINPSNTSTYHIGTRTGSLWVGFENTGGRPAAVGTRVSGLGFSSVGTLNFASQIQLPSQPQTYITVSGFSVGPAGQVMTTWLTQKYSAYPLPPKARVFTATAGGLIDTSFSDPLHPPPDEPSPPAALVNLPMDGYTIPSNAPGIIDANPHVAYDTNVSSPHYGRAHLVYDDVPDSVIGQYPNDSNVYALYSDNNGLVGWTAGNGGSPVNDDGGHTSQFWPQLAVDPTSGNLAVTWFDARVDPTNNILVALYGTVSTDGGSSFAANARISADHPVQPPPLRYEPQGRTNGPIVDLQDQGTITGVSGTSLTDSNQHWIFGASYNGSPAIDWWQAWTPPFGTLTPLFSVTAPSPYPGTGNTYASIADNNGTTLSLIDQFGPPDHAWSNGIPTVGSPYTITGRDIFTTDLGRYTGLAYYNGAFYPAWSDNSNSTGDNPSINVYNNWTLNDYFTQVTVTPTPGGGQAPAAGGGSAGGRYTAAGPAPLASLPDDSATTPLPRLAPGDSVSGQSGTTLVLGPGLPGASAPPGTGQPSAASAQATGQPSPTPPAAPTPDRTPGPQAVDLLFAGGSQLPSFARRASSGAGSAESDPLGEASLDPDWAAPFDGWMV